VARAEERGSTPHTLQKKLEVFLEAAPYPAGDPKAEDPDWAFPELTDSMIDGAVQAYRGEFKRRARHEQPVCPPSPLLEGLYAPARRSC
jgi:hypothetical protein